MGGHGRIGVNGVLGILIVAGVTIPALTAMRLYINLRGEKRRGRRAAVTKWGVKAIGEGFLVVVALLSTVQVVLWGWNAAEELMEKVEEGKPEDWVMVPGIPYLKVGLFFLFPHPSLLFPTFGAIHKIIQPSTGGSGELISRDTFIFIFPEELGLRVSF